MTVAGQGGEGVFGDEPLGGRPETVGKVLAGLGATLILRPPGWGGARWARLT